MKRLISLGLVLVAFCFASWPARAHYNMLLPETASAKRGDTVAFLYQWGHPFEHQLFDAPAPRSLWVLSPDGKKSDLISTLEKAAVPGAEGKTVTAWRFRFKPEQRGDYVILLAAEPIWMEEEHEFWQDSVKVVLHVQAQKNWDAIVEPGFEIVPLTRPYGLQPGMVFQAALETGKANGSGLIVEVERYNQSPPKALPADEQITRTVKTDRNNVLTCSLPEAGWWGITAQRESGKMARNGKEYSTRQRTTLWVFVDEKIPSTGTR